MTEGERTFTNQRGHLKKTTDPAECVKQWALDGITYTGCAYATGATLPWCATKVDHNGEYVKGNKGYCKMTTDGGFCNLHPECTTDGAGGSLKAKCLLPWTYNGITYDGCANPNGERKPWGPIKENYNESNRATWGYCKMNYDGGLCNFHGPRKRIIIGQTFFLPKSAFDMNLAVSCQWSLWGPWGGCSNSCGGGTQYRRRSIRRNAMNGGMPCEPSEGTLSRSCNADIPCPGESGSANSSA